MNFKLYFLLWPACLSMAASAQSIPALQSTVRQRTGREIEWRKDAATEDAAAQAVRCLQRRPMNVERAVQIALLNNRELQGTFESIGIANADLIEAGLLKNPVFLASPRFPDKPPGAADVEFSVVEDFLDLLMLPLRKKVAREQLARTELQVGDAVLKLAADTRCAFYRLQAARQLLGSASAVRAAGEAALQLALRQHEAGNISDLDLANEQAASSQSELEVMAAQIEIEADRETLNRLLGLEGAEVDWDSVGDLAPLPGSDPPERHLEAMAMEQRLDLAATEAECGALGQALGLTRKFRFIGTIELGADTENQTDNQRITGPTLQLELPIFNHGQGRIARLEAQLRQAARTAEAEVIDIRADVREAVARVAAQRKMALYYRDDVIPQRRKIIELTTTRYNSMLQGGYDLVLAKQNELSAERGAIESLRDYWIARAELDRATGGAKHAL